MFSNLMHTTRIRFERNEAFWDNFSLESNLKDGGKLSDASFYVIFIPTRWIDYKINDKEMENPWNDYNSHISYTRSVDQFFDVATRDLSTTSRPLRSHPWSIKYELVIRQVSSTSSTREINYWVKADRIPPLPFLSAQHGTTVTDKVSELIIVPGK